MPSCTQPFASQGLSPRQTPPIAADHDAQDWSDWDDSTDDEDSAAADAVGSMMCLSACARDAPSVESAAQKIEPCHKNIGSGNEALGALVG